MKSETVNLIIITVIIVLLAFGLGLIIVQTVDNRLSNISINMPEIKVPPANVVVRLNNGLGFGGEPIVDQQTHYQLKPKNKKVKIVADQQGGAVPETKMCKNDQPRHYVADVYKSRMNKVDKIPEKVEPTEDAHTKSLPARYPSAPDKALDLNPEHNSAGEKTYYLPLERMTPEQKLKFKSRAKFNNMTLQDYTNWLTLYKEDQHNLSKHNRQNLKRMLRGDTLTVADIPRDTHKIHPTAAQGYQQLTGETQQTQPDTTDSGIHAANYEDFDQYMPPKNLKHMTHFNPDEDVKFSSPFLECMKPKITSSDPKEMGNPKDLNQNFQKQLPKQT